jgi:hypothetical protein
VLRKACKVKGRLLLKGKGCKSCKLYILCTLQVRDLFEKSDKKEERKVLQVKSILMP